MKDCSMIEGDSKVIISRSTAIEALHAVQKQAAAGAYKGLYADDATFVNITLKELQKAAED